MTITILASGQSNFEITRVYPWSPPSNLTLWNWDGTEAGVGTAFAAVSGSSINVTWKFAALVAEANPAQAVRLINISLGSIGIAHWLGTGSPDMAAILAANVPPALAAAGVTKADIFLWWQGETDAAAHSLTYEADFELMLASLRTPGWITTATPAIVFGLVGTSVNPHLNFDAFNNTLRYCVAADEAKRIFVNSANFGAAYWDTSDAPTPVHMTGAGYDLNGTQAYNAYYARQNVSAALGNSSMPGFGALGYGALGQFALGQFAIEPGPLATSGGKGGYFDPYYYKKRNKRRTKAQDVETFLEEVEAPQLEHAQAEVKRQAEEARAAALAFMAQESAAMRAEALKQINSFYRALRIEIARREAEDDEDFLLLSS